MEKLNNYELNNARGGGIFTVTGAVVATLIAAFVFGILDGIVNPQECN